MNKIPKIVFEAMTFEENIQVISMFIFSEKNKESKPNTDYFKSKYSLLSNVDFDSMTREEITNKLLIIYDEWLIDMKDYIIRVIDYQKNWDLINDSAMNDLSKRLNIVWPDDCLQINARVGIMYYCPRYIRERTFNFDINSSNDVMREISFHEICHFLYFEKWKELYHDYDEAHYNTPHIIWYLSEAMIDPLLNNDVFKKYTNIEIKSYDIFYKNFIGDKNIIEILRKNVEDYTIEEAIRINYELFLDNSNLFN